MNWADFHFIRPYWLLAIIPALGFIVWSIKTTLSQGEWSSVCDAELLPFILEEKSNTKSHWVFGAISIATVLSVIALAGPVWERLETPAFRNDAALVIALDLSQTMNASDITPSRLVRARYKIADILRQRKDGLTALVVYAGDAFTVTPLTNDIATINNQLNALESNLLPRELRSIKDEETALALAIQLLKQAGQKQGNIFLITDGVQKGANELGVETSAFPVSILGVGTHQGGPVKLSDGGFLKDSDGNIIVPKLPSSELASLAQKAGGTYSDITADDSDIKKLLSSLDRPITDTTSKQNNGLVEQWNDMGSWLLLLVLPLAALGFRQGILMLCLLVILPMPQTSYAVEWNDLWSNKNQQAQQSFQNKQFKQAAEQLESPQWKAAAEYKAGQYQQAVDLLKPIKTANSLYNQGNSFAQLGQLGKAKEAYESSLKIDPNNEDTKHNLKEVEKALKKQPPKSDQKQKQKDQKQGDKQQDDDQSPEQSEDGNQQTDQQKDDQEQDASNKPSDQQNDKPSKDKKDSSNEGESKSKEANDKQQTATSPLSDEERQASEQWLNRVQDDPAGLLKRKFKYQYGQRQQR